MAKVRKHGLSAYASGACRCRKCQAAWAEYIRMRRRRQHTARGRRVARRAPRRRRPYYAEKAVDVRITPLGAQILLAAEKRTDMALDDLVERLVREHGPTVAAAA